jgi:hypothetical protein
MARRGTERRVADAAGGGATCRALGDPASMRARGAAIGAMDERRSAKAVL